MKTQDRINFDEHQTAIELGYSEQDICDFAVIFERLESWRNDVENGKVSPTQMPAIEKKYSILMEGITED